MRSIVFIALAFMLITLSGCTHQMYSDLLDEGVKFQRWLVEWEEKNIELNGVNVSYLDNQSNSQNVILFVHGYSASKDNWNQLAYRLNDQYRLIAIDLLGHGKTDLDPNNNYLLMNQVKLLQDFIAALNISKIHLIGNSMGGGVSLLFALHHPDKTRTLTLIDSAGVHSPTLSPFETALQEGKNILAVQDLASFEKMISLVFYDPPWIPMGFKNVIVERATPHYDHYQYVLSEILKSNDIWRESGRIYGLMPELQVDTLLIWGRQDNVLNVSSVDVFNQHLPKVESHIIEECGHVPMIEKPDETAALIEQFFAGTSNQSR